MAQQTNVWLLLRLLRRQLGLNPPRPALDMLLLLAQPRRAGPRRHRLLTTLPLLLLVASPDAKSWVLDCKHKHSAETIQRSVTQVFCGGPFYDFFATIDELNDLAPPMREARIGDGERALLFYGSRLQPTRRLFSEQPHQPSNPVAPSFWITDPNYHSVAPINSGRCCDGGYDMLKNNLDPELQAILAMAIYKGRYWVSRVAPDVEGYIDQHYAYYNYQAPVFIDYMENNPWQNQSFADTDKDYKKPPEPVQVPTIKRAIGVIIGLLLIAIGTW